MNSDSEILKIDSLAAGYGNETVLQNVSFKLYDGEILVVVGENGSGKSTLLRSICGMIPRKSGHIFFKKNEIKKVLPYNLAKIGISYFLQDGLIIPDLTIKEHLELALMNNLRGTKKAFDAVFDQFPKLYELRNKIAGTLSGGERQILSFGILQLHGNKIWFLDEPTAGLSPSNVEFTSQFLQVKSKEEGITMLIIEHNLDVACKLASNILVVKQGTVSRKYNQAEFTKIDFLETSVYN